MSKQETKPRNQDDQQDDLPKLPTCAAIPI